MVQCHVMNVKNWQSP